MKAQNFTLLIYIYLLVSCVNSSSTKPDQLIKKNSVSDINLGTTISDKMWEYYKGKGIQISRNEGVVNSITVTSPDYQTEHGIRAGDDVAKLYKSGVEVEAIQTPIKKGETEVGTVGFLKHSGIKYYVVEGKIMAIIIHNDEGHK